MNDYKNSMSSGHISTAAHMNSMQDKARKSSNMENGHDIPYLVKELFAISFWKRKGQFTLEVSIAVTPY